MHGLPFLTGECLLTRAEVNREPALWLFAALGPRRFAELQRRFGGRRIWIAKYSGGLPCPHCPRRDRHLRLLRLRGASAARLARRFRLTPKHVYAVLKKGRRSDSCPK